MSARTALFAALRGLFADRVYPGTFPQPPARPTWPACRYTLVTAIVYGDICGHDDGQTDDETYQLDVVAANYDDMRSLVRQVRIALEAVDPPCVVQSFNETFDAETKTHRGVLDVTFFPSSSEDSPA